MSTHELSELGSTFNDRMNYHEVRWQMYHEAHDSVRASVWEEAWKEVLDKIGEVEDE